MVLRGLGSLLLIALAVAVFLVGVANASQVDRTEARVALVIVPALALLLLWPAAWVAAGRNPFGRRADEDVEKTPRRFVGARAALLFAVLPALFMLASLSWPPRRFEDWWSVAFLAIVIAGCVYAAATLSAAHGRGRRLVVWMAALQLTNLVIVLLIPHPPGVVGPALALSYIIALTPMVCITIAALLVWSVRGRWRPQHGAAAAA